LSDDGRTVLANEGVWSESAGWITLPNLPGAVSSNWPFVLSGDGRVVFGYNGALYRWTADGGTVALADNPSLAPVLIQQQTGYQHHFGTNTDGSVLIGCGNPESLRRWTEADGFTEVPVTMDLVGCGGWVHTSSDARTVTYGADESFFDVAVAKANDSGGFDRLPFDSTEVTVLNYGLAVPTAISGDGRYVAGYARRSSGYLKFDQCLSTNGGGPACHDAAANQLVLGFDHAGDAAVGQELPGGGGARCPFGTFYWSRADGIRFVSDLLFERGLYTDMLVKSSVRLSSDNTAILGVASRHWGDGRSTEECFLADFAEPSAAAPRAIDGVTGLGLGSAGGCAVQSDGTVSCWGADALKFVGSDVSASWSPVVVPVVSDALQVATDVDHSCALLSNRHVLCWGKNDFGQLGDGSNVDSVTPVEVSGLDNAIEVSVRGNVSCAVLDDGRVQCWGSNANGQLGDGTQNDALVPRTVPGLDQVQHVVLTAGFCTTQFCEYEPEDDPLPGGACVLRDDGSVWCWRGVLPSDGEPSAPSLVQEDVEQITAGPGPQLCWLHTDGTGGCALGIPSGYYDANCAPSPSLLDHPVLRLGRSSAALALPPSTQQIATGGETVCALLADGTVQCLGADKSGALGRGKRQWASSVFAPVLGIHDAIQIAVGGEFACAVVASGTVQCWGRDDVGQLGNGHVYKNFPYGLARPGPVRAPVRR
jgi:hypothetical protein